MTGAWLIGGNLCCRVRSVRLCLSPFEKCWIWFGHMPSTKSSKLAFSESHSGVTPLDGPQELWPFCSSERRYSKMNESRRPTTISLRCTQNVFQLRCRVCCGRLDLRAHDYWLATKYSQDHWTRMLNCGGFCGPQQLYFRHTVGRSERRSCCPIFALLEHVGVA